MDPIAIAVIASFVAILLVFWRQIWRGLVLLFASWYAWLLRVTGEDVN